MRSILVRPDADALASFEPKLIIIDLADSSKTLSTAANDRRNSASAAGIEQPKAPKKPPLVAKKEKPYA